MEENKTSEEARKELVKEYPPRSLIIDPVAIWGFLTIWSIVGWFLAGLLILLRIKSPHPIPAFWIVSFVVCIILNAIFGTFTARHARLQRKKHTH